jgi:transglutaminase-like putative cysteine protease
VLKTSLTALEQETYRTTRENALADAGPRRIDLVVDNSVPVNRALANPHETQRIRYRVVLKNDDPSRVFYSGDLQQVKALDPHTAEVTVRSEHAAESARAALADQPATRLPNEGDRQPNNLIQSDDPVVVEMAKSVEPTAEEPREIAVALERFVKQKIKLKNFSQAFASAAEVARTPEGDCTEHAVLLAALARARGIPARVAIGLVYQPGTQSFAYHMWNELWIGERWVPFDATLGRGGIGAAHLKLTDSNLAGAQAYRCFLPVAQVIGQLKIEILDVE